jgi:riboflavin biosynthesis pyrimidine reductase
MIRRLLPETGRIESDDALEQWYRHPTDQHLRVNFVATLDGAIEVGGRSGPLGGPADRQVFMAMRAVADVILVGSGTATAENYGPVRLEAGAQARRRARGQPDRPRLAVVSGTGRLDPGARMFTGGERVLVFTTEPVVQARPDLAQVADLVGCGDDRVEPNRMVSTLHGMGLTRILCEGGPALARGLFSAALVDELCLTVSPVLAGAHHQALGEAWPGPPGRFELTALLEADGMLMTRYAKVDG